MPPSVRDLPIAELRSVKGNDGADVQAIRAALASTVLTKGAGEVQYPLERFASTAQQPDSMPANKCCSLRPMSSFIIIPTTPCRPSLIGSSSNFAIRHRADETSSPMVLLSAKSVGIERITSWCHPTCHRRNEASIRCLSTRTRQRKFNPTSRSSLCSLGTFIACGRRFWIGAPDGQVQAAEQRQTGRENSTCVRKSTPISTRRRLFHSALAALRSGPDGFPRRTRWDAF
jgi:hypothetical protein